MKVLFHVDNSERWGMALGNASNLLAYAEEAVLPCEVEIVANGPAVRELLPEAAQAAGLLERLTALSGRVCICACNNALRGLGIAPGALLPFVTVVPAGVAELALRQEAGFSYIKP